MLLVCVDAFCKSVWLFPVRDASTAATTDALKQKIFTPFSLPEVMVCDSAKCYVSTEFRRVSFIKICQENRNLFNTRQKKIWKFI